MNQKTILDAIMLVFHYRLPKWNIYIIIAFLIMSTAFVLLLYKSKLRLKQRIYSAILYVYSYNVLVTTIFMRERASKRMYNLVPFSEFYKLFSEPYKSSSWEVIFNTIMFVSIGFLIPCIIKKSKFKRTMLIGICSTIAIEIIQFTLKIGEFETDDIIANTLGTLIGFGIYLLLHKLKSARQSKNNQSDTSHQNEHLCI